jgi:8-oxo-dGTP diphosphatase
VPNTRFHFAAAVYGVLVDGDRLLLIRRAGTGYRDGQLSVPAGHLDGGEDAVSGLLRELREEVCIDADRDSCRLAVVMHRAPEDDDDSEYLDLFFTVDGWSGTPVIGEPDKCSELTWVDRHHLPADVVDYVAVGLQAVLDGEPLVTYGWRLREVLRWEQSGAHWRVVSRTTAGLELSLLTCDGGEEMDRWTSTDPALLAHVGTRTSDEDTR